MSSVEFKITSVIEQATTFFNENKIIILIFHFCIQLEFFTKYSHIQTQELEVQMVLVPLSLIHPY